MNTIDVLMERVDKINALAVDEVSAADIDTIIAYHRAMRKRRAEGEKIERKTVDIAALLDLPKSKAVATERAVKRRF